ncbi:MAG: DUF192 domain-containing protein [Opitutales bacterium]|nr:DUF192 domain-containing protein [Opitutales bacterium]
MRHRLALLCLFPFFIVLAACRPEANTEPVAPKSIEHRFTLQIGEQPIQVQVAVTAGEQRRGLMFRESLNEHEGMIFIYPTPQPLRFWMLNVPIHLDIGFFDSEGVLLEVHRMVAHDTTGVASQSREVRYALEMKAGWFAANGIRPGVRLDLALLRTAVRERGFNPDIYIDR